jgi:ElaB/YqjD/DUF883 family membrane-anchored ribosome-binding protein
VVIALDRTRQVRRAKASRDAMLLPLQEAGRLIAAKPLPSVLVAAVAGALVALLVRRR